MVTNIWYNEPQYDNKTGVPTGTKRVHVKTLEVNFTGEDAEYFWFRLILDDDQHVDSYPMKGVNLMGKLKLFVWTSFIDDYTSGLAVALAHDVDEARRLILADYGNSDRAKQYLEFEPEIVDYPKAFSVCGGG